MRASLRDRFNPPDENGERELDKLDAFWTHMLSLYTRHQYREERQYAEFVDLGGEG
jgi:hypothetical protein